MRECRGLFIANIIGSIEEEKRHRWGECHTQGSERQSGARGREEGRSIVSCVLREGLTRPSTIHGSAGREVDVANTLGCCFASEPFALSESPPLCDVG